MIEDRRLLIVGAGVAGVVVLGALAWWRGWPPFDGDREPAPVVPLSPAGTAHFESAVG